MKFLKIILFFIFISFIIFCMYISSQMESKSTSYPNNACKMLKENPDWYASLIASEKKWNTPPYIILGMMRQESSFKHDAKPLRKNKWYEFGYHYQSSATGYSQALNGTWEHYKRDANSYFAHRESFADATDFMGWYNHTSNKKNKIAFNDPKNLYLAYHEGWNGYSKKTYEKKGKEFLNKAVNNVYSWSNKYKKQITNCKLSEKSNIQIAFDYIKDFFNKK